MFYRMTRICVLAAIAFASLVTVAQAEVWKLAHIVPPDSPEGKVHQRFAELVDKYTDGKMRIEIFPAGQLGKTPALLQQLQAGTIQIFPEGAPVLHRYVEDITWIGLPFMFNDREHWVRFMNSDLVAKWKQDVREQAGIAFIGDVTSMIRGPYRVLATTRPVKSLDDVKGLKLRMFENKFFVRAWQHLGAEVIVLGWTDVYESLRRGVIDGVTSPISLVEPMKFYEPAKHIMRTDEFPQALAYMTNAGAWDALDNKTRQAMIRAQQEASQYAAKLANESAAETLARMKAGGAAYSEPDMSAFVASMAEFYKELVKSGEMPAAVLAKIEETRN